MRLRERTRPKRCAYCHGDLKQDADNLCACGGAHVDCARTNGLCPVCGVAFERPKPATEVHACVVCDLPVKVTNRDVLPNDIVIHDACNHSPYVCLRCGQSFRERSTNHLCIHCEFGATRLLGPGDNIGAPTIPAILFVVSVVATCVALLYWAITNI